VKRICFDAFVHRDLCPNTEPELLVYDRIVNGIVDVNNRSHDIGRLESDDTYSTLGFGFDRTLISKLPRYRDLLVYVHSSLEWSPSDFRRYRVRIDYPIFGSKVTLVFNPPEKS
jgi:hypothetical protein